MLSERAAGLFFPADALRRARANRDDAAITAAIALLDQPPADPPARAHLEALRYQFAADLAAGESARMHLRQSRHFPDVETDLPAIKRALGYCALAALLVDHPAAQPQLAEIAADIHSSSEQFNALAESPDLLTRLWLNALNMATGVLLDNDEARHRAAEFYRDAVDRHIHPEGYFKGIADQELIGSSYEDQLSATCALIVTAEMAARAALDLWAYEARGVSPITAAAYCYFYYFYPEKWRWEPQLTRERTIACMRREGAFMELVNQRHALHGIEQLFAEQRPLFCHWGGGLTTLTHGLKHRPRRRWRLW